MSDKTGTRINKHLADLGYCSRREADRLIEDGLVKVNGKIMRELFYRVQPGDEVLLHPKARRQLENKQTIVYHKPLGVVSNLAEKDYKNALDCITRQNHHGDKKLVKPIPRTKMAPLGRLDINSTGLLLLSQDGHLAKLIIGEKSHVEKEYQVTVNKPVTPEQLKALEFGLELDGQALKRAQVKELSPDRFHIVLTEGKKRQIRRMAELVGLEVVSLKRVRIGQLKLGSLPYGQWRFLKPNEKVVP